MYYSGTYGTGQVDILRALFRITVLSVQNSGSREEFNGVSVNGPLFPPERWTL